MTLLLQENLDGRISPSRDPFGGSYSRSCSRVHREGNKGPLEKMRPWNTIGLEDQAVDLGKTRFCCPAVLLSKWFGHSGKGGTLVLRTKHDDTFGRRECNPAGCSNCLLTRLPFAQHQELRANYRWTNSRCRPALQQSIWHRIWIWRHCWWQTRRILVEKNRRNENLCILRSST